MLMYFFEVKLLKFNKFLLITASLGLIYAQKIKFILIEQKILKSSSYQFTFHKKNFKKYFPNFIGKINGIVWSKYCPKMTS